MVKVQVPRVGRVVHFVYGNVHCAALITAVDFHVPDPIGGVDIVGEALTVFPPNEAPFTVVTSEGTSSGTWHWPEMVPPAQS
jgi:hypothetical protein